MHESRMTLRGVNCSWRAVFGSLAGGELVFRTASNIDWTRIIELLRSTADSTLLTGLLSLLSGAPSILGDASTFTQLLLYAIFLYAFVPEPLPDVFGEWTAEFSFRLLMAALAFVMFLQLLFRGFPDSTEFSVAIFIGSVMYLLLFKRRETDHFDPPEGSLFQIFTTLVSGYDDSAETEQLHQTEWIASALSADASGIRSVGMRSMIAVVCCGTLSFAFSLLGLFTYVVSLFFPFPELIILGWSAYGAVSAKTGWGSAPEYVIDFESTLYETLHAVFQSPEKGIMGAFYLSFGFYASALPFLKAGTRVVELLVGADVGLVGDFRPVLMLAVLLGPLASGVYGFWFWWRTSRRFPAFIRSTIGGEATASVTRPVWLTLPPTLLLLISAVTVLVRAVYLHDHPSNVVLPVELSAVSCLLHVFGLSLMIAMYFRTRKSVRQKPASENQTLPIAATIQVVPLLFAASALRNYDAVKQNGLMAYFASLPTVLTLAGISGIGMLVIFYYRDIYEWAEDIDGNSESILKASPSFVAGICMYGFFLLQGTYVYLIFSTVAVSLGIVVLYSTEHD